MHADRLKSSLAVAAIALIGLTAAPAHAQEALPSQLAGTWRITRALPTQNTGCWESAASLVGTTLTYRPASMRWHGGEVQLNGVVTRTLTSSVFEKETASAWGLPLRLTDLNIQSPHVLEIDLQHEDADITGSTTEVPGDSVLLVGRNTIVVSACGSFFQATRISPGITHMPGQGELADNRPIPAVRPSNLLSTSFQKK